MDEIINVPLHRTHKGRIVDGSTFRIAGPDIDGDHAIRLGEDLWACTHADLLAIHTALGRALGLVSVPMEATEAMVEAALDWSIAKYGHCIGNEDARECWAAMFAAWHRRVGDGE